MLHRIIILVKVSKVKKEEEKKDPPKGKRVVRRDRVKKIMVGIKRAKVEYLHHPGHLLNHSTLILLWLISQKILQNIP
jgi:hypothetical protein